MIPQGLGMPPSIPGVSQTAGEESPLDKMMRRMSAKPQPAMGYIREAIQALKRAIRLDPSLESIAGPALMILTSREDGTEQDDEGEPSGRRPQRHDMVGNREMRGPSHMNF